MDSEVINKEVFLRLIKRFDNLEAGLMDKFSALLKPLSEGLEKMNANLQQVSKLAEETKSITLKQQSDIITLYNYNDKLLE